MKILHDYQIRFLDPDGILTEDLAVVAESLAAATQRAGEIASEIGATDFIITLKREAKDHVRK